MIPTPKAPVPIDKPVVLIVEGPTDEMFFSELVHHLNLDIHVRRCGKDAPNRTGGIDDLPTELQLLKIRSEYVEGKITSIGVIVDNDEDPAANFKKVQDALLNVGLPAPDEPFKMIGENPRIGAIGLPAVNIPGRIEDLCLASVKEQSVMDCVRTYFECLREKGIDASRIPSKAEMQVYLASKAEVGFGLGRAAQKPYFYWDWKHIAFAPLITFLQELVN